MKRALITGITGQDGSYLAELLLEKGYRVSGTTRGHASLERIAHLIDHIEVLEGDLFNESFIQEVASRTFDEFYNLASVSSVQNPWEDPIGTLKSTGFTPLLLLEALRASSPATHFFQSSSAEMYGDPTESPQNEATPMHPHSPYGWGKLLVHNAIEGYRAHYELFAVSGILFNHESPRRGDGFVTRKITTTLARIAKGSDEILSLGNLDAKRDWCFAGDVVRGMWLSLQREKPDTYVFASGESHTVREFVEEAAQLLGIAITWQGSGFEEKGFDHEGKLVVATDPKWYRPQETQIRRGDITRARAELDWKPEVSFRELVARMVQGNSASAISR